MGYETIVNSIVTIENNYYKYLNFVRLPQTNKMNTNCKESLEQTDEWKKQGCIRVIPKS